MKKNKAQNFVELSIILALVSIISIAVLHTSGQKIASLFSNAIGAITDIFDAKKLDESINNPLIPENIRGMLMGFKTKINDPETRSIESTGALADIIAEANKLEGEQKQKAIDAIYDIIAVKFHNEKFADPRGVEQSRTAFNSCAAKFNLCANPVNPFFNDVLFSRYSADCSDPAGNCVVIAYTDDGQAQYFDAYIGTAGGAGFARAYEHYVNIGIGSNCLNKCRIDEILMHMNNNPAYYHSEPNPFRIKYNTASPPEPMP